MTAKLPHWKELEEAGLRGYPRESSRVAALAIAAVALVSTSALGQSFGSFTTVSGRVNKLSLTSTGDLLFCTEQRDVGTINLAGQVTLLANATTGPFPSPLRGVVQTPTGDVSVIDSNGDIYRLPNGIAPAVKVYSDLYMISAPTDLLVDASGNYVTVSQSPSTGVRAVNWVSSDGQRWGYYAVKHQGIGLAQDPTNGDILLTDAEGTGALRLLVADDESHPTVNLDTTTNFGFSISTNDGDMAVEANGNVLIVAGNNVYRHNRTTGTTSVIASGHGGLRSIVIAASSGNLASSTGYSAYIGQGTGPTTILELTGVQGPGTAIGPSLGTVPSRGIPVPVNWAMNAFEILRDDGNNLLVGGDLWGANPAIRRVNLQTLQVTTVANQGSGILSRIVGMSIAKDGSIYAATTNGEVQRIVESPLGVTTVFADPSNQIDIARDLAMDRDGSIYVAARQGWGTGYIARIQNGVLTNVSNTLETLGLAPDPFTGRLLAAEWVNVAFNGRVRLLNHSNNTLSSIPGFEGMNYSNAGVWADGDLCEDAEGNIYTCSEDDWSVYRYHRSTGKLARIASGYLNRPAGLAIARSTAGSGSTTDWSLYVCEYNLLWEIPSVPAPASTLLDAAAPPVGRLVGSFPPGSATLRAMVADPQGGGFYVTTSNGTIERMTLAGSRSVVAGAAQGLTGDLMGIAVNSTGKLIVASRTGRIHQVDPAAGFGATLLFSNPGNVLTNVGGVVVDGMDRIHVIDRPSSSPKTGRLYRLTGSTLTLLNISAIGSRGAIDPLTGDLFLPQVGNAIDGGGEILRIDLFEEPPTAGNYRGSEPFYLPFGPTDGSIAFTAEGNFFTNLASSGRVLRFDRSAGTQTFVGGNYIRPTALAVAPGRPGIAGSQGTSLFVLDAFALYEIGIEGTVPTLAPAQKPKLAPGADLRIAGLFQLGGVHALTIESPPDANRIYLVFCSLSGKVPGFPLNQFGNPNDPRVIPNNPDFMWSLINTPQVMPDFYGILDPAGFSMPTMGLIVPNDPSLLIGEFLDFAWVAIDFGFPNGFATVGGTTQIYLGN